MSLSKTNENSKSNFYGHDFLVTPDVLVPRPETEQLIDMVLYLAGKPYLPGMKPPKRVLPENPTILDVGTGSGCIAITLALELPEARVYASEISKKALAVARQNAKNLHAEVNLIKSDLLSTAGTAEPASTLTPDLIVANLPYVDKNWDWLDKKALSSEPEIALYADDHGLALIKKLIDQAATLKIKHLVLESDPCQHEKIAEYCASRYTLQKTMGFIQYYKLRA